LKTLRSILGVLALSLAATACLSVPESAKPECTKMSDCDTTNGEVCEDGVCWGNPPEGAFVAVISPPSDRNLVTKELTELVISEQGWLSSLQLERPVTVSGDVDAVCTPPAICDRGITATITITRDSHFAGGPGFKTVVSTKTNTSGATFEANLPRTRDGDAEYIMTIVPDGRGDQPSSENLSARLVPPMRVELGVPADISKVFVLGGVNLPVVDGTLVAAGGGGLSQYRVVAMGRWKVGAPPIEVSTVDYTDADGKFRLVLSDDLEGDVEIVAKSWGGTSAPTLRLGGIASDGPSIHVLQQPAMLGSKATITVPVKGKDGGGEISPVRGARVRITAQTTSSTMPGSTLATFVAEGTTNDAGVASLEVLDGQAFRASYKLEIVPPASASVGVVFDEPLEFGNQPDMLLPARVKVRGVVLDNKGEPIKDVSVTVRPSLRFAWSLADKPQAFLSAIPAATAITPSTGEFVVWVDPTITDLWGHYDLVFEPPTTGKYPARAPLWVQAEVAIGSTDTLSLPDVVLPDAAFVHGAITDPDGLPVEGAEVKVFRVNTTLALCSMVPNAPLSCPIPATLQGRGASDALGLVRVTLPR